METGRKGRIPSLESVRGLAALAVVVSHLIMAFAEPYQTGWPAKIETVPAVIRIPLELLYRPIGDGQFAVMVFFVLSGVVLSQSYLHHGKFSDLTSGIVRRYPRLAIPAILSACISCALWQAGLIHNHDAARLLSDADVPTQWINSFQQDHPSYGDAIRQSGFEIFFSRDVPAPGKMYNSVLWTMRTELFGSMLIFGLLGTIGKAKQVGLLTVLTAIILEAGGLTRLALFPAGMALAVLRRDRPHFTLPALATFVILLVSYFLCGCYTFGDFVPRRIGGVGMSFVISEQVCGLAGILVVAVVLFAPPVDRFLEWPPFCWLGKVSFGLYLIHLPIILSLGTVVFIQSYLAYGHAVALLLTSIVTIAASLPGAWVMFHLADRPAVWLGKQISRLYECLNKPSQQKQIAQSEQPIANLNTNSSERHAFNDAIDQPRHASRT